MALKLTIDKIEEVPESQRALYVEKNGKFQLDVDGIEDNTPLKNALSSERKRAAEMEKRVKGWERLGKTPEEIEALVAAAAQSDEEKLTRAGEWDKLKTQMHERHKTELKALQVKLDAKDGEIKSMQSSLESHLIDAQATAAIAAAKGVPDLLLPHVQKFMKVIERDGKYITTIVDGKGEPRTNGKGDPISIGDLLTELKANETYGRAFESSGNSGSGARPGNGAGGGAASAIRKRSDLKSEKERSAYIDDHGLAAYQSLPF